MNVEDLFETVYARFNARDIDGVLAFMHPDVVWPNGMEGGTVLGHEGIRGYWTRQWRQFDPRVVPTRIVRLEDGRVAVDVHQVVRDIRGTLLKDVMVKHVYTLQDGLIRCMEIREEPADRR